MNGFGESDCREFVICQSVKYRVVLYQCEILRLIRILEVNKSWSLARKFRRMIFIRDFNEGKKTDFDRILPRSDPSRHMLSPRDYAIYENTQREFDQMMEDYYAKR